MHASSIVRVREMCVIDRGVRSPGGTCKASCHSLGIGGAIQLKTVSRNRESVQGEQRGEGGGGASKVGKMIVQDVQS